jgi:hypothetical protein
LPGSWIGEACDAAIPAPLADLDEETVVAGHANSTLPVTAITGNNGGALPATAKLDSAK